MSENKIIFDQSLLLFIKLFFIWPGWVVNLILGGFVINAKEKTQATAARIVKVRIGIGSLTSAMSGANIVVTRAKILHIPKVVDL